MAGKMSRLEKIGAELEKARVKRAEWDRRIKELERSYREEENTQIHEMVHAANLNPEQLAQLIRQAAASMPGVAEKQQEMEEREYEE